MKHLRPSCNHCVYWMVDLTVDRPTVGHCHRYPPGIYINPQTGTVVQKFPLTDHLHWCGEWSDDDAPFSEAAKRLAILAATSPPNKSPAKTSSAKKD